MQAIRVQDVIEFLTDLAPPALAEDWDNVGLLLGDRENQVERAMTCLTVTPPVVAEAIAEGVSLIVSHHPMLFRPVQRIVGDNPEGRMVLELIGAGIAVYSPHTAYDSAESGINQQLAELLGLQDIKPLRLITKGTLRSSGTGVSPVPQPGAGAQQYKLAVFVPEDSLEPLARALFDAGAGRIGEYSECSFRTLGTGTFFGSEAANPAVGRPGRREEVAEYRLEVVCPGGDLPVIVAALREAHPYEEPAFDVYPLVSVPDDAAARTGEVPVLPDAKGLTPEGEAGAPTGGAGRYGTFPAPVTVSDLIQRIKSALATSHVGLVGRLDAPLTKVAVACGAAGEFLSDAADLGCDAFVTGETRFHTLLDAQARGVTLLLPGHYATERFAVEALAECLAKHFPTLFVAASRQETDPLAML